MANRPIANGNPEDASKDFKGDIKVNNRPPNKEQLERVADLPVLDVDRKSYTFKSLYADNENGPRRVLVVFIRHFFCGNCQEYIRALATSITPSVLSTLSPPTSIVIIGCGQPEVIPMYTRETACPFPIYADPTRKLYDMLGMTKALSLGHSPEYLQRSLFSMAFSSFLQELRSGRKMLSGGDFRQVGGELLFSGGKVTFCKRMKNTRDHAELPEIRKHLGLDRIVNSSSDGEKPETKKRWSSSGLGAGLGRRLSFRRRSWAPARSTSKNNEAKGNPPRNAMQEVKEEGAEANASATPEDALAKLEGKAPANEKGMNGEPINGPANGIINGAVKEKQTENGAVLNGSVDDATNGAPNGHVTA